MLNLCCSSYWHCCQTPLSLTCLIETFLHVYYIKVYVTWLIDVWVISKGLTIKGWHTGYTLYWLTFVLVKNNNKRNTVQTRKCSVKRYVVPTNGISSNSTYRNNCKRTKFLYCFFISNEDSFGSKLTSSYCLCDSVQSHGVKLLNVALYEWPSPHKRTKVVVLSFAQNPQTHCFISNKSWVFQLHVIAI